MSNENIKNFVLFDNPLSQYPYQTNNNLIEKISLSPKEKEIFSILKKILEKNNLNDTIFRVAGGWVRDKLLNRENIDIDIAINNKKGYEIAKLINDELYPKKNKIGLIQQNSQKGKHLETATIKINGIWLDFVNLRCDDENKIGNPIQDAKLRDITINSLFYNLNEEKIEDFTNFGINDLKNGIIRTSTDSNKTFHDDPLRILRVLRFATKFQFKIDDEICENVLNDKNFYKEQFLNVISIERIEKEIKLILQLSNPQSAIYALFKFDLLDSILKIKNYNESDMIKNIKNDIIFSVNLILIGNFIAKKFDFFYENNKEIFNDKNYRFNFFLFLLTIPYRNYLVKFAKEKELISVNKLIVKESFKMTNEELKENSIMNQNLDDFINLINNKFQRLQIAQIIRQIHSNNLSKEFIAGISFEYIKKIYENKNNQIIHEINENILNEIVDKYKNFYNFIKNENLLHIDDLKPLFDGNEIIKILNIKPGKIIGILIESLINIQIEDPKISKESAIDFLTKKRNQLKHLESENNQKSHKKKQ